MFTQVTAGWWRPSSGTQNCTYSFRYCQTNTDAIVDEKELRSISSKIAAGSTIGSVRYFQNNTADIVDEMDLRSTSSTTVTGSSIGLTIPDAVCTVLCSC